MADVALPALLRPIEGMGAEDVDALEDEGGGGEDDDGQDGGGLGPDGQVGWMVPHSSVTYALTLSCLLYCL